MRLDLRFAGTDMDGRGTDPMGSFDLSGIFSAENGRVLFTVAYTSHEVEYSGVWDGHLIYGKWTVHDDHFTESGDFEMWPEKTEERVGAGSASYGEEHSLPGSPI